MKPFFFGLALTVALMTGAARADDEYDSGHQSYYSGGNSMSHDSTSSYDQGYRDAQRQEDYRRQQMQEDARRQQQLYAAPSPQYGSPANPTYRQRPQAAPVVPPSESGSGSVGVVASPQLKIRTCPAVSNSCREIDRFDRGEQITVLQDVGNGWVVVQGHGSVVGYARRQGDFITYIQMLPPKTFEITI